MFTFKIKKWKINYGYNLRNDLATKTYFGILLLQHLSPQGSLLLHPALPILTGCFLMASPLLLPCFCFCVSLSWTPVLMSWLMGPLLHHSNWQKHLPTQPALPAAPLPGHSGHHSSLRLYPHCLRLLCVYSSCFHSSSWVSTLVSSVFPNCLEFADFSPTYHLLYCHTLGCDIYLPGSICHYCY